MLKYLNNIQWEKLKKANPHIKDFSIIIDLFFKPDIIYYEKLINNLNYIEENVIWPTDLDKIKITKTLIFYKEKINRPLGYPNWFLAGYPDICYWLSQSYLLYKEKHPLFKILNNENNADTDGYMNFNTLRLIIDYYKKNISKRLECSL